MILKVLKHDGIVIQDTIEYAVVKNENGENGILENHVPFAMVIKEGFVKAVNGPVTVFIAVHQGLAEFKNNLLTILAIEAEIGETKEGAFTALAKTRKEKLDIMKKEAIDFSEKERELRETIKKAQAGHI